MTTKYLGLTSQQASLMLQRNGPNSLPEKKKNLFLVVAKNLFSLIPLMLLAAAFLSLYSGNDVNFWIILFLFVSNSAIGMWHERKADKSIKQLQAHLAVKVPVFRDGAWTLIDSVGLVEGDVIMLKIGAVVPADISILESKNLSINESVLTGESLPKEKKAGDISYSGSYVTTGNGIGTVTATGASTFFGKTIVSVDVKPRQSSLEKDILSVSKFISIISIFIVIVLTAVLLFTHSALTDVVTLDLSLLIAGIPVALPTVMSLIISIGILNLAKKQVIVRRLASLEDLANVNLLLSDKTGTLTQNTIKVERIISFDNFTEHDVALYAVSAVSESHDNPLDDAIFKKAQALSIKPYPPIDYTPGDSERKRSTVVVSIDGKESAISSGAPQIIASLCALDVDNRKRFDEAVQKGADGGYRAIAIAINREGSEEKNMTLVGILFLADSLHVDAKSTVEFMSQNGIGVKMITGDSLAISERIAGELGIKGDVVARGVLDGDAVVLKERFDSIGGFAEVLPKDKYEIVSLARAHHVVAMTGDGVNDLPAVKNADVGFAVSTAVDALKGAADIVLLKNGIAVIKDAIIEARDIFARLYNYSLYRISESFRLIITIAVIGLIFKTYPLTPVQLIILAFLNDVPIISLAFDRVKATEKPAHIDAKKRFTLSTLFGLTGVANSLILLYIMVAWLHLPWPLIQTMFFLKLTVSGHMLVYVAHTKDAWFKYLPSKQVIFATVTTQLIATALAFTGFLTAPISLSLIILVWVWSFFWMQVSELAKQAYARLA
ncbi:MAG TPA: plasma-membrane proton-efflux P-type ATPase [Candidatus Paceibacterota bacterium]|nr:plasma-membrane proton-efflux P-type ATPase [Candidatus Paceibacterota bacterium]